MARICLPLALVLIFISQPAIAREPLSIASPDGHLILDFALQDIDGSPACPVYRLRKQRSTLVSFSRLGLSLDDAELTSNLALTSHETSAHDETWQPVYGERSLIRDHYQQLTVHLAAPQSPGYRLAVTFRLYDEGLAFCYTLAGGGDSQLAHIAREQSEFRFTADHTAWAVYSAQGRYEQVRLSQIKPGCERPLTIAAGESSYLALGEARLVDYARMKLAPLPRHSHALVSQLDGPVESRLPMTTPWRTVTVASSAAELLAQLPALKPERSLCPDRHGVDKTRKSAA